MSLDGWKRASFLVASESNVSNVKQWEPLPGGSVRPSGPCCFAVARAPFVSLDGWKRASFLVGSESNVRHWEPLPGGSVRPSGPCCFAQWEICPGVGGRGRSPLIIFQEFETSLLAHNATMLALSLKSLNHCHNLSKKGRFLTKQGFATLTTHSCLSLLSHGS